MNEKLDSSSSRELIAFRIDGREFCVDIMQVRDIRGWTPATPLPHSPAYVRGVINLRGAVVPVIDLQARFGRPAAEVGKKTCIVIFDSLRQDERVELGLLVDAVCDIISITDDLIQATPDVASEMVHRFVKGILSMDGRMISLISLDRILPDREAEAA